MGVVTNRSLEGGTLDLGLVRESASRCLPLDRSTWDGVCRHSLSDVSGNQEGREGRRTVCGRNADWAWARCRRALFIVFCWVAALGMELVATACPILATSEKVERLDRPYVGGIQTGPGPGVGVRFSMGEA